MQEALKARAPWPDDAALATAEVLRPEPFWPDRLVAADGHRIGIIPLPVYVILVALVAGLVFTGEIKPDAPTMIVVLSIGGFTCAEIGKRLPILRNIGAGAIFATFIPSALVYYHAAARRRSSRRSTDFTKFTNFLYLFIASIIVGSILGMDRDVLIKGFLKIFVPLGGRLDRGRRSSARWSARAGARRLPHVLLHRRADHGRRRRRRRDPAVDRLRGDPRTSSRATCSRRCCRR